MDDGSALVRAICEQPDEDTPRLVYADWCDENGQPERAEFIRLQCRIASGIDGTKAMIRLREQERKALRNRWDDWCPQAKPNRPYTFRQDLSYLVRVLHGDGDHMGVSFARGFVDRIESGCADFLDHAEAIFRAHPVTAVRLSDRKPLVYDGGRAVWNSPSRYTTDHPDVLPQIIHAGLRGFSRRHKPTAADLRLAKTYRSLEAATDALSESLVAHARKRAGLGQLAKAAA
jgi:uncharacterized protein (TIGR02996 family)